MAKLCDDAEQGTVRLIWIRKIDYNTVAACIAVGAVSHGLFVDFVLHGHHVCLVHPAAKF